MLPRNVAVIIASLLVAAATPAKPAAPAGVLLRPARPFIEDYDGTQLVNFDIRVVNRSAQTFHLVGIAVTVFDHTGRIEQQSTLDTNGFPGALGIVGPLWLSPNTAEEVFQPFTTFPLTVDLYRLHFTLAYMRVGRQGLPVPFIADTFVSTDVFPKHFEPVAYCLPLRGAILVQDGHDFFSHHRRLAHPLPLEAVSDTAPAANLYAEDFVRTGASGNLFTGSPTDKHSWLTYGSPVFSDAAGVVVGSATTIPEHSFLPNGRASSADDARDPNGFGNYVELMHPDGRVSWFLHMQPGSVRTKPGDHLSGNVQIGLVGFSGDALFPHLHYNVTQGAAYPSQGVPAYFRNFDRIFGQRRVSTVRGSVNTGDLVESQHNCSADRAAP